MRHYPTSKHPSILPYQSHISTGAISKKEIHKSSITCPTRNRELLRANEHNLKTLRETKALRDCYQIAIVKSKLISRQRISASSLRRKTPYFTMLRVR